VLLLPTQFKPFRAERLDPETCQAANAPFQPEAEFLEATQLRTFTGSMATPRTAISDGTFELRTGDTIHYHHSIQGGGGNLRENGK